MPEQDARRPNAIVRAWCRVFPWRTVWITACWIYEEHRITGRRRATARLLGGYQPLDHEWLRYQRVMSARQTVPRTE
jgi:hypothetical protein